MAVAFFVASFITRRPGFDPRSVRLSFMVATVAMGVVFHRIIWFFSVNIISQIPDTHVHVAVTRSTVQADEAMKP